MDYELTRSLLEVNGELLTSDDMDDSSKTSILTLVWDLICEENEREKHLVTPKEWEDWVTTRDKVNKDLENAQNNEEIVSALNIVKRAMIGHSTINQTHNGYHGTKYTGMFHGHLA